MAFSRGSHTLSISAKLFAENRSRLINALKPNAKHGSVVVLKGGSEFQRYDTDSVINVFRQESYFFWAFGVHEEDFYGAIDIDSGKSILFPPRLPPVYAIICGKINPESYFKEKYGVDEVHFNDERTIATVLKRFNAKNLLLLRTTNTDSNSHLEPATFCGDNEFEKDISTLYPIMANLRVFKTDMELEVLRYAAKAASEAQKSSMKLSKPGLYEYQFESNFCHVCSNDFGCRNTSFTCIAASGPNSAVLHYGAANAPNNRQVVDGDLCLLDMGAEYNCYASDITITFPCNGKFTDKQKIIYNAVLAANRAVFKSAKPGVCWVDMHLTAERVILEHLKAADLLVGEVNEMLDARLGAVFMPHGLGHFVGVDVHDVGGYLQDALPRPTLPGLKSLRTTRKLQERMVITVEPGCYFIDSVLDEAIMDQRLRKFLNLEKLKEFRGFGGVRIEDDVVIWEKGNELLTNVPRTVEEIEAFMRK
uniref:Xaa-Pro dipeptidase n=1 Tax=Syphacia muris TaxID=451379 RepID=A0A0N5AQE6_9BILA